MEEVFQEIGLKLTSLYNEFLSFLPSYMGDFFNFILLVMLVVLYSIIIWKFSRFIAHKNIIQLNLNQYNRSEHPSFEKMLAGLFYFLEYIIILPFLIFIWFAVFTLCLIFLTDKLETSTLLLVSATVIAAIRMTAYYKQKLSEDIAKLLPFNLLAVSLLYPGFFNVERVLNQFISIPGFFKSVFAYLFFIIILEIILRFFDFIFSLFGLEEDEEEGE